MKVFNANGTTAYDTTSPGGVFVKFQVLPVTAATGSQIVYLPSQFRGMSIKLIPLQYGDHTWSAVNGNVESAQDPTIIWSNKNYTINSVRKNTLLMVLAK